MSGPDKSDGRKTKVFLSYSRRDSAAVRKLAAGLEREYGIEVFRDTEDILPTEEWKQRLEDLIGEADTIVFALSPNSAKSEICRWEVDHAESLNKRIAPVVIRQVAPSRIPKPLTKYNYIFFTRGHDFNKALANLVTALNVDIDWIREHTRIGEIARRWDAQRKLGAQPLRGKELTQAEDWLAGQPEKAPAPTLVHRDYIRASRRAATRRLRYWLTSSIAGTIVTVVLALYGWGASLNATSSLAKAMSAADTLVIEIAVGMKDFKGVPIARIRSVLEKAEDILKSLESAGNSSALLYRQARMLHSFVSAYETLGEIEEAQDRAEQALNIMQALVAENPGNALWMHYLSISYEKIGNLLKARGDLTGAEKAFRADLTISERLAASDPTNTRWQSNLSISHSRIGTVLLARGDLTGAEKAFRAHLMISKRLAASDPANTGWQKSLSFSHTKIGDVLKARDDIAGAEKAYRISLVIRERLAASDPANTGWQSNLSASYVYVGDIQAAQGDLAGAEISYRASLTIIKRLAASDPANTGWQHDLSASYDRIGNVLKDQGDLNGAEKTFRASLATIKRLAASDPANTGWRRNLSISHGKIGTILKARGDLTGAEKAYRASLTIIKRLSASDPANAVWRTDLAISHNVLGKLVMAMRKPAGALTLFEASRATILSLAKSSGDKKWLRYLKSLDSEIARAKKALAEVQ